MIRAEAAHRPAVEAALSARPELAMFPLDNLARHGMAGGHPRAMTFWLDDAENPSALLGLSEEGMAMPLWPDAFDAARAAAILSGRPLMGLAGPTAPVRALMAAAELDGAPVKISDDEPQFLLHLADLAVPEGAGTLAPISIAPDLAAAWRAAFYGDIRIARWTTDEIAAQIQGWIAADSHRFLVVDGVPVALTGFNAALPDIVQVGGVYTPPELRSRGHARRAVGLHLAEARARGATRATLVAASENAVACYRPLGFRRIGAFTLTLFDGKVAP